MNITNLKIQKLPGRLPISFVDEYDNHSRLLFSKSQSKEVNTEWNGVSDIKVYYEVWDTYKWGLIIKESTYRGLENLRFGDLLTIEVDQGDDHNAQIIEFSDPEYINNTTFIKLTVEYKDLDSLTITNFFDYTTYSTLLETIHTEIKLENFDNDGVTPKSIDANWQNIINGSSQFILNTNLEPIEGESPIEQQEDNQTGLKLVSQAIYGANLRVKGYFNTTNQKNLVRYLQLANRITITYDSNIYIYSSVLSEGQIEIEEIGRGIYSVEFSAKTESLIHNYY